MISDGRKSYIRSSGGIQSPDIGCGICGKNTIGICAVLAESPEEAEEKAKKGEFDEIMDEQDNCLLFIYNGEPIGKELGYDDAGEEDNGEDEEK